MNVGTDAWIIKLALVMEEDIGNTNGFQFLTYTVKIDWLYGKHMAFGKGKEAMNITNGHGGFGSGNSQTSRKLNTTDYGQIQ